MTGEHAHGHAVQLWRSQGRLLGLLLVYVGPEGDPPTGLLEDVVYDAASGELSFRARLSLGMTVMGGDRRSPSRDLFVFRGELRDGSLSGVFEISDRLNPEVPPRREVVTLRLDKGPGLEAKKSAADWRAMAEEILSSRGPRW